MHFYCLGGSGGSKRSTLTQDDAEYKQEFDPDEERLVPLVRDFIIGGADRMNSDDLAKVDRYTDLFVNGNFWENAPTLDEPGIEPASLATIGEMAPPTREEPRRPGTAGTHPSSARPSTQARAHSLSWLPHTSRLKTQMILCSHACDRKTVIKLHSTVLHMSQGSGGSQADGSRPPSAGSGAGGAAGPARKQSTFGGLFGGDFVPPDDSEGSERADMGAFDAWRFEENMKKGLLKEEKEDFIYKPGKDFSTILPPLTANSIVRWTCALRHQREQEFYLRVLNDFVRALDIFETEGLAGSSDMYFDQERPWGQTILIPISEEEKMVKRLATHMLIEKGTDSFRKLEDDFMWVKKAKPKWELDKVAKWTKRKYKWQKRLRMGRKKKKAKEGEEGNNGKGKDDKGRGGGTDTSAAETTDEETEDEVEKAIAKIIADKDIAKKEMEVSLRRVFNLIDLDGNGTLEKDEVLVAMRRQKNRDALLAVSPDFAKLTKPRTWKKTFKQLDVDGDGNVDFQEWFDFAWRFAEKEIDKRIAKERKKLIKDAAERAREEEIDEEDLKAQFQRRIEEVNKMTKRQLHAELKALGLDFLGLKKDLLDTLIKKLRSVEGLRLEIASVAKMKPVKSDFAERGCLQIERTALLFCAQLRPGSSFLCSAAFPRQEVHA